MKDVDLSRVMQPSRYLGMESGLPRKDASKARLRFCLAFPDLYEVGMSHLGHQILYSLLNHRDDVLAERAYAPWIDVIDILEKQGILLKSSESGSPINRFDVIGFTWAYELAVTNILLMLKLGGVPVLSADRGRDDPIVIAGGPCVFNPEPLAPFIDAFFLGEAEEGLDELLDYLISSKPLPRMERLEGLSGIKGVYVPSLIEPIHNAEGGLVGLGAVGARPVRRVLPDLEASMHPISPLVPVAKTVHERLVVEVARGCTRGCRFCQAGSIYRPVRERGARQAARMIESGLAASGYDQVSLLSLSAGDYTCILPLLTELIRSKSPQRISVALPSLRVKTLTESIMRQIASVKRTGFTLAPEAGSERLRIVLNKPLTDEDILDSIRRVFAEGWDLVKLYFMIGLPTETLHDVEAIVDLTHRALAAGQKENRKAAFNINVATYVPKAHTPFQWAAQLPLAEAKRRLEYIKTKLHRRNIQLKWQAPPVSLVEGVLARGNRDTAKAVWEAFSAGCRLDAWNEHFQLEAWEAAFSRAGFDLHKQAAWTPPFEGPLPWDVVDSGIDPDYLRREWNKAIAGQTTEDCRNADCNDCGACAGDVRHRPAKLEEAVNLFPKVAETSDQLDAESRYRLRYSKTGNGRFLGHLELVSCMQKALRRSGLPLSFSRGYSPAPKVAFGPPLPVGVESLDEHVDIFLSKRTAPEKILEAMGDDFLPQGLKLLEASQTPLKAPSIFQQVRQFHYKIIFDENVFADAQTIEDKIEAFNGTDPFPLWLERKGKSVNLHEYVLELSASGHLEAGMVLRFSEQGSVSPVLAAAGVFGLDEERTANIRLCKLAADF